MLVQQEVLINWSPQETRVAILEHSQVQELHIERKRSLTGNIYLGKVIRVLPGMQSAFIDIGLGRAAFLHVSDFWQRQSDGSAPPLHDTPLAAIEKRVFEGQIFMVQVLKDPIGNKGARLTTQISIAGRLLVFLPQSGHLGVSQKIPIEQRETLRERLKSLTSTIKGLEGGFILRTNAESASDDALLEDMQYLHKIWDKIQQKAQHAVPRSLLHQELTLVQRVLRDLVDTRTQSIRIDSHEQFCGLQRFASEFMPQLQEKIQHYNAEKPIFDIFGIDEAVRNALGRRVELKSGGYLIIDQTEAMTSIDVNTGAYVGARNFEETIYKTNLEAAAAIVRELRLRNLGGIIIIDFIDMEQEAHQKTVLEELQKRLCRDRVKTTVSGFSGLGLVEMTRKRTRQSLTQMLCESCPVCHGNSIVKTVQTVAYEILREVLREARQFNPNEFRIVANPAVCELFIDEESPYLEELSAFINKRIYLQADPMMTQEQYDIVLM